MVEIRRLRPLDEILREVDGSCVGYTFYDSSWQNLYEGMSCDPRIEIRKRLRDPRFQSTFFVEMRPGRNRMEVRRAEAERIRRHCPIHNIQHAGSCPGR